MSRIRRSIWFECSSSVRAAVRQTAVFLGWSIDRRTSVRRTPVRICGNCRCLRHRHAQLEGRISAHADDRRSDVVHQQPESYLSRQQRRAESVHESISPWVNNARAGWDGVFRAGAVDARSPDAAGCRAIRSRRELVSRAAGRSVAFLPSPIIIPETRGVDSYKDITPRMGVAYDVFGNGRTAIKMTLGRYLEGAGVIGQLRQHQPDAADAADDVRSWAPRVSRAAGLTRNTNFVPDCDLRNPAAAGYARHWRRLCGVCPNHEVRHERSDQQLRRTGF